MSAAPLTVVLPGLTLIISPELVPRMESALRERRRARERDLIAEITAFLSEDPGSSVVEIARAIRARDHDVRSTLLREGRFQRLSGLAGRSPRANLWVLASEATELVPGAGTSAASEGTEAASGSRRSQLLQGHEEAEPLDG